MSQEISGKYEPIHIEERWNKYWMDNKLFKSVPDERPSYTIVIPPPNVTGVLHMGHMLNNTIQDVLIRRARMRGFNACWVPGTDHASIATEAKVVQKLRKEGIKKSDLSRDEFLEHAWEWTHKHGGIILEQLKKLGASCDWDRTRFTMDEKYYESVIDTFIDLYKKGKIYRGERMINWDPAALTALSDEEVIYKEIDSKLFYVKYAIAGSNNEFVTIATTRPETILGDTAICINPKDERYMHLHGKKAIVPLLNREIPIITDEYVEMEFGTGCLKVTPAHDMNDFMLGEKHKLQVINMMNADGTISEAGQLYVGMDRFEVRSKIVEDLEAAGNLVKTEVHINKVGFSERTDVIIEPRLSLQWFVDMKDLSKPALDNVMNDNIRFFPPKFKNSYRNWMENIKDWCISRQLWWGHRIPAYYAPDGTFAVAKTDDEAFAQLSAKVPGLKREDMIQDPDVLDTWFSSWLWPISVFDGFYTEDEVKYYYPTADLVTAPEIMFFWVARMIIAGYEYRGELPFKNVYYTGIVRDKQGRKMSKSLGNSPDPLDLMAKYGADGVRFGMLISSPAGNDLLFDESGCEQGSKFCNKIWNASKLLSIWKNNNEQRPQPDSNAQAFELISNELNKLILDLNQDFEEFKISEALKRIYTFVWDDFFGWYLERIKPEYGQNIDSKSYADSKNLFLTILQLLHPFMPYISEELWHQFTDDIQLKSINFSQWPLSREFKQELSKAFANIKSLETSLRNHKLNLGLKDKEEISVFYKYYEISSKVTDKDSPIKADFYFLGAQSAFKYYSISPQLELLVDKAQSSIALNLTIHNMQSSHSGFHVSASYDYVDNVANINFTGFGSFAGSQFQTDSKTLNEFKVENKRILQQLKESRPNRQSLEQFGTQSELIDENEEISELTTRFSVRGVFVNNGLANNFAMAVEAQFNLVEMLEKLIVLKYADLISKSIKAKSFEPGQIITTEDYAFWGDLLFTIASETKEKNIANEIEKLEKELYALTDRINDRRGFLESVEKKLSNEKFMANAKPELIEREMQKKKDALNEISILDTKMDRIINKISDLGSQQTIITN